MDYVLSTVLPRSIGKKFVYDVLRRKLKNISKTTTYKKSGGKAIIMLSSTNNNITTALTSVQMLWNNFFSILGDIHIELAERYLRKLQSDNKYPYQLFLQYRNTIDAKIEMRFIWDVQQLPIKTRLVISKNV